MNNPSNNNTDTTASSSWFTVPFIHTLKSSINSIITKSEYLFTAWKKTRNVSRFRKIPVPNCQKIMWFIRSCAMWRNIHRTDNQKKNFRKSKSHWLERVCPIYHNRTKIKIRLWFSIEQCKNFRRWTLLWQKINFKDVEH